MTSVPIGIEVRIGDALEVACDVLVLKYAQGLHGVDRRVAQQLKLELTPTILPPDGYRLVASDNGIAAEQVLFVGVVGLRDFRYREIREFVTKALRSLAGEAPEASHVAFTLHGPGYGLDESECFLAELAGVIDATSSGDLPRRLEKISIIEQNPGRASRLLKLLARELPDERLERDPQPLQRQMARDRSILRSVGFDSAEKPLVFVAMPINDETEDLFHYGIEQPIDACGLICERIDKVPGTGDLVDRIKAKIGASKLVVAELTGSNPNVFLEVGYAWGHDVPTILLASREVVPDLPFDVKTQTCIVYESIQDLEEKLRIALRSFLD